MRAVPRARMRPAYQRHTLVPSIQPARPAPARAQAQPARAAAPRTVQKERWSRFSRRHILPVKRWRCMAYGKGKSATAPFCVQLCDSSVRACAKPQLGARGGRGRGECGGCVRVAVFEQSVVPFACALVGAPFRERGLFLKRRRSRLSSELQSLSVFLKRRCCYSLNFRGFGEIAGNGGIRAHHRQGLCAWLAFHIPPCAKSKCGQCGCNKVPHLRCRHSQLFLSRRD
jgi:hypothetical protein